MSTEWKIHIPTIDRERMGDECYQRIEGHIRELEAQRDRLARELAEVSRQLSYNTIRLEEQRIIREELEAARDAARAKAEELDRECKRLDAFTDKQGALINETLVQRDFAVAQLAHRDQRIAELEVLSAKARFYEMDSCVPALLARAESAARALADLKARVRQVDPWIRVDGRVRGWCCRFCGALPKEDRQHDPASDCVWVAAGEEDGR